MSGHYVGGVAHTEHRTSADPVLTGLIIAIATTIAAGMVLLLAG
ncbi:MAG TPA: hypothetical protein VFP41_00335 [Actinomycetota bacterium]|nr:hypothetical protein [Actinomycetota bacterium]